MRLILSVDSVGFEQVSGFSTQWEGVGNHDLINVSGRKDAAGPNDHSYGFLRKVSMHVISKERRDKTVTLYPTLNITLN